MKIQRVLESIVVRSTAELEIVLERHADKGGDRIVELFDQLVVALLLSKSGRADIDDKIGTKTLIIFVRPLSAVTGAPESEFLSTFLNR